jgi:formylglycine-generating enzyme required for sulfatase activity
VDAQAPAAPGFEATLSDFWLGTYEVTVGRFRRFVEAGGGNALAPPAPGDGAHPAAPESGWRPEWSSALAPSPAALRVALRAGTECLRFGTWTDEPGVSERRPINCVTWFEAYAFCAWDGARLPTEAEWTYAAAAGAEQRVYPWSSPPTGSTLDETRAVYGCIPDAGCDGAHHPAVVGSVPEGAARWGAHDLAGNVAEWLLDWKQWDPGATDYLVPCQDCVELTAPGARALRGGSFASQGGPTTDLRVIEPRSAAPSDRRATTGIRCARSVASI